jgi:hypothetical protein
MGKQAITSGTPTKTVAGGIGDLPAGCPPSDAITGPKQLYRLTKLPYAAADDFLTTKEEGTFLSGDPCQRCSISTLETKEAAIRHRSLIPNLRGRNIAKGVVPRDAGFLKNTPSKASREHWSWWPSTGIARHTYFEIIDEPA